MTSALRLSPTTIYVLLVLATGVSFLLGTNAREEALVADRWATAGILLVAAVKVRFVILDFMDVRDAPPALRLALEGWVVGVVGILAWFFCLAPR